MLVYCVVCGFVAGWDATAKPCETVADAYCALPACEAWIVHVPAATSFAVARETVHTAGVEEAKMTGRPELALALSFTDPPATCAAIVSNAMVCCCEAWAVKSDRVKHACNPITTTTRFIIVK